MKKGLIAGVSALVMCLSAVPLSASADETDVFTEESIYQSLSNEDIEELQAQSECSFAYGDFLNELPHNYTPMFSAIEESSEYVYPDDYAGTYFNEYNDNKMTLYLTSFDNLEYYKSFFDSDICHFELVEYSYNDLLSLFDYLSYDMSTLDLNAVSVDELNNKVKVGISEELSNKEEVISYVDNLGYDTDMIEFEYTTREDFTNNSSTNYAYSGNAITVRNSTNSNYSYANATIGYNAYCSSTNKYGIVTAGHLATEISSNYRYVYNKDNVLINNSRSSWIYENNSTVDALFIPFGTVNSFSPSLYIRNALNDNGIYILQREQYITSPAMVNMTVYSFGATTGMQQGKIINLSTSAEFNDGTNVQNFIQTNIVTQGGDSGGPLVFFTTEGTTKMALLGICKGSNTAYSYFCKYNVINDALGIQTYSYENS